jgi:superfamily II DNA or RNA helicase
VQDLGEHPGRRVVVVAPTQHLKHQWADAALRFGLHLDPEWSARDGILPPDMHGIVTTYQQVSTSFAALAPLARGAFVVFDEIHHAADDRSWGNAVLHAFEHAGKRLSLSGTQFRSDTSAIPFVDYHLDEARADYEYGYGDALGDGRVVRPVYFPRTGGEMEWSAPDGSLQSASFDDALDAARSSQRHGYFCRCVGVIGSAWGQVRSWIIGTPRTSTRPAASGTTRRARRPRQTRRFGTAPATLRSSGSRASGARRGPRASAPRRGRAGRGP